MITQVLHCPYCHGTDIVRQALSQTLVHQRFEVSYARLVRGLGGKRVELFGRSVALVSCLDHLLSFLDHVHEFNTD